MSLEQLDLKRKYVPCGTCECCGQWINVQCLIETEYGILCDSCYDQVVEGSDRYGT